MGAARGPALAGGGASSSGKSQLGSDSDSVAEHEFLETLLGGLCAPEVELGALWAAREYVSSVFSTRHH